LLFFRQGGFVEHRTYLVRFDHLFLRTSLKEMKTNDQEDFQSALLLTNEEILALGVKPSDVELFRRMRYQASFGISSWYDSLKDHTFQSSFVVVSPACARAMLDVHHKSESSNVRNELLVALEAQLDTAIKEVGGKAFVKLNTRSPKDVPIYDFENAKLKQLLDENLALVPSNLSELERENLEVAAFVSASQQVLCVAKGSDALSLLLKSQRVAEVCYFFCWGLFWFVLV
jgi:hypothetical protein